jgi:hypothetical protein
MALVAAAGVIVGGVAMPSAKAADLGGDCCADLEERVAELEATTARKGNRKVSLTITGQVNRAVVWWDDGHTNRTYWGLDNTSSSSRFSLLGSARISPKMQAGFEIMIELEGGGTSSKANQFDEDGKISTAAPLGNNVSFNGPNVDGYFGDARRVAAWLEHADVGRLTLGRYEGTGTPYTIDLGGIGAAGPGSKSISPGGGMFLRGSAGQVYNLTWGGNIMDPIGTSGGAGGRVELLRYDSPALAGFILSAHIAEASDYWGVQLRYAGEFAGVRIAAHIGTDRNRDEPTPALLDPTTAAWLASLGTERPEVTAWGTALSLLHVPTGLFVQGHWYRVEYDHPVANGYWGSASLLSATGALTAQGTQKDLTDWQIQAGIAKNWFGWGNTAIYGEYGQTQDMAASTGGRNFAGATACGGAFGGNCTNFSGITGVVGSDATLWGIGIVQYIDAAAMEVYVAYRNYSVDIDVLLPANRVDIEDLHVVTAGSRIKF